MRKVWFLALAILSAGLMNGCSRCTREEVPPPPAAAPATDETAPAPDLPREGEPATPPVLPDTPVEESPD